jgi:regulator of protease activity HflC (stomatin/prohibitin superfamily)
MICGCNQRPKGQCHLKDGVNVTAQINVRYQLAHRAAAVLHKLIGPQYLEMVVSPEIGSQAREVISKYPAGEVYTSRDATQEEVRNSTRKCPACHGTGSVAGARPVRTSPICA